MDFGSILIIIALCIPVALFIARPFFERKSVMFSQSEHDLSHWLAERDQTLTALQELDFDYSLGKIPEEDYPTTRAWLVQRGTEILRTLDELQPTAAKETAAADRIEAVIASRRAERAAAVSAPAVTGGNGHKSLPDDSIETLIAARRRQHNGKAAGFCYKCGGAVQKTDQFCPKCGAELKSAA